MNQGYGAYNGACAFMLPASCFFHPLDICADRPQSLFEVFIAPVEVFDAGDNGPARCGEGRDDKGHSGADIEALCCQACLNAFREHIGRGVASAAAQGLDSLKVEARHFQEAVERLARSRR
mgnify:CR=1 FL=1